LEVSNNSLFGLILAIGIAQAVFFSFLLLKKRKRTLSDFILATWLFILAIHISANYLELVGYYEKYPNLIGSTSSLVFIYGPLLFMYLDSYISREPKFKKSYLLHLLPFIIYNILMVPFYFISGEYKLHFVRDMLQSHPPLVAVLALGLRTIILPVYIILALVILRRHQSNIKSFFSHTEEIDLEWLKYLIWSIAIISILILLSSILKVATNFNQPFSFELIVFISVAFWIFAIGYYGLKKSPIFIEPFQNNQFLASLNKEDNRYQKTKINSEQVDGYLKRLNDYMEHEKPFTKSRLTINLLSEAIDIPSHHLSQLINDKLNQNFFDFINQYRVNEAKVKLLDPGNKHLTILGIAFDSGFNSKASFNRIFKKFTGLTPSEFLADPK